jgi:ribose transport system permease protein
MVTAPTALRQPLAALKIRELPALLVLGLTLVWLYFTEPRFWTVENRTQVGLQIGLLGIVAMGEGLVILTGGIDLSVGAVLAMSACVAGERMSAGTPWQIAVLMALAAGALAGFINGALVTYRKLTPILTTLSTLLIFRALTNIWTGAIPYNQLPKAFTSLGLENTPLRIFLVVVTFFAIALARSRFGRRVVAVGGSEQSARLSGIPTDAVVRRVYIASGVCAALGGLLMSAGNNNAQWNLGDGWELEAIAAVVIGGVRLTGGEGSLIGAATGAAIIVVLRNALFLKSVPSENYGLITGAVIVIAALTEQFRRAREAKT